MSKINELVEWMNRELHELEIYIQAQEKSPEHIWHPGAKSNTIASLAHQQQMAMEWREKARQLLAEEQEAKPTADKGLVEEILALCNATIRVNGQDIEIRDIDKRDIKKILSRYEAKQEEPLACLADRKGRYISYIHKAEYGWDIGIALFNKSGSLEFNGNTYAEAESKARHYLMGLPDREGRI
jgi:hypothetical protein